MINLIWEYLVIILILFGVNFGVLLNLREIKGNKIFYIIGYSISLLVLSFLASNLSFDFLTNYTEYFLFIIGVFIFILTLYQLNKNSLKIEFLTFFGLFILSYILIVLLLFSMPTSFGFDILVEIFIFSFVFSFVGFVLSKNSNFKGKVSEFFILESILLMILGMTYPYVKTLKYDEFLPFTILTPNYELIILVILIVALLVSGVLLNDYGKAR